MRGGLFFHGGTRIAQSCVQATRISNLFVFTDDNKYFRHTPFHPKLQTWPDGTITRRFVFSTRPPLIFTKNVLSLKYFDISRGYCCWLHALQQQQIFHLRQIFFCATKFKWCSRLQTKWQHFFWRLLLTFFQTSQRFTETLSKSRMGSCEKTWGPNGGVGPPLKFQR